MVRYATDIKVGIARRRCAFTEFVLEADIPAFLRKGALEAPGGQLDSGRDALTIRNHGVSRPLKVNEMGLYVLSVVAFGKGPLCVDRGPKLAAPYFEWAL